MDFSILEDAMESVEESSQCSAITQNALKYKILQFKLNNYVAQYTRLAIHLPLKETTQFDFTNNAMLLSKMSSKTTMHTLGRSFETSYSIIPTMIQLNQPLVIVAMYIDHEMSMFILNKIKTLMGFASCNSSKCPYDVDFKVIVFKNGDEIFATTICCNHPSTITLQKYAFIFRLDESIIKNITQNA